MMAVFFLIQIRNTGYFQIQIYALSTHFSPFPASACWVNRVLESPRLYGKNKTPLNCKLSNRVVNASG